MTYRLITLLLWPAFFIYTLKIFFRDKSSRYFFQRLGFSYPTKKKQTIWIHCASVGEVNTYTPLHHKLLSHYKEADFVITTNTVTGANTVARHKLERTQHCFLPIESSFAIKRFIKAWQPSQCLIMETELWPLLYQLTDSKNISISIINARLSHRTLKANDWIKSLYNNSLKKINKVLCKSAAEAKNYKTLGASNNQLIVAGNLKFTCIDHGQDLLPIELNNRAYCLAASTHDNEEQQLATLWNNLKTDTLLVIAPRHPNRSKAIQKQLDSVNVNYAVRSQQEAITDDTKIYLADTLGELTQFMLGAEFVFMGGSLIEHGGQNILEPCRLGKPTLCGPHMFNFKEEMGFLLSNNACIQVNDISELENIIGDYFSHPKDFIAVGDNAKNCLKKQSEILDVYLSVITSMDLKSTL